MMLKRYILTIVLPLFFSMKGIGQSGISMYHLGNETIQGSHFNPSFIPEGKLFLGLPLLSGIGLDFNSRISYSDIVIDENGRKIWNTEGFTSLLKNRNYVSLEGDISTFYLGVRANETTAYSFFVNEKFGARLFMSKDVAELALEGTTGFIGDEVNLSQLAGDARYYREMGIGYWKNLPEKKLSYGVRLKYIVGFFNASSDNGFDGKVRISNDNFRSEFELSNTAFNTSGVDLFSDGSSADIQAHLIGNGNTGIGLDLGANWEINKELSASFAINDIGFINWKVDPKNYSIQDTTFNYGGLTLRDISDFQQSIEDSISDRFITNETTNSYKTSLNARIYGSVNYKLNDKSTITGTVANHGVVGKLRLLLGVGYTRKFGDIWTISGSIVKAPQRLIPNLGLSTAVNLGAFQFYMASDKLLGLGDVTKVSALDFRFGINFIFGRQKKGDGKLEEEGRKGGEGIYQKIPLQKPRPVYEKHHFREV